MFKHLTLTSIVFILLMSTVVAASPRINYLLYCSGCHRPHGEGNPPNVPNLHDELGSMMNVPEMRSYLAQVPGSAHAPITDTELTDVLNWMLEQFSSETLPDDFKKLTVEEVTKARSEILADPNKYRADFWKPYDFSEYEEK